MQKEINSAKYLNQISPKYLNPNFICKLLQRNSSNLYENLWFGSTNLLEC